MQCSNDLQCGYYLLSASPDSPAQISSICREHRDNGRRSDGFRFPGCSLRTRGRTRDTNRPPYLTRLRNIRIRNRAVRATSGRALGRAPKTLLPLCSVPPQLHARGKREARLGNRCGRAPPWEDRSSIRSLRRTANCAPQNRNSDGGSFISLLANTCGDGILFQAKRAPLGIPIAANRRQVLALATETGSQGLNCTASKNCLLA
jgi:hypothetical protein